MGAFLVTGGCGFIGSHLCEALTARGDEVSVLDDLSSGFRENLPAGARLVLADTADPDAVARAMEGVDGCFHLAAIASVQRGVEDWRGTHRVNLGGAVAVFDAARARRVPVVYASSAATYGDFRDLPIAETAIQRPLSAYGADKMGCELHARVATHVFGVPTVGLRFFNVYGPRQDPRSPYSGVISIFCERLRRGESVTVFGDGEQTRDFIYVADVIAALLQSMRRQPQGSPVFNVCTGRATSVLALAETIAALRGQAADIRHTAPREGEVRHSLGSPDAARAALGLGEPWTLSDGLARVLAWMDGANAA